MGRRKVETPSIWSMKSLRYAPAGPIQLRTGPKPVVFREGSVGR